jgi:hypothetical protein
MRLKLYPTCATAGNAPSPGHIWGHHVTRSVAVGNEPWRLERARRPSAPMHPPRLCGLQIGSNGVFYWVRSGWKAGHGPISMGLPWRPSSRHPS